MKAVRRGLRRVVERTPLLARIYRDVREELRIARTPLVITPHGFRLQGDRSMQTGTFEPEETALIARLLERADLFVDIGANVGYYTCLARSRGKHVVAIEPLASNLRRLYRNLDANGWKDVEVWPLGLSADVGTARLYGAATGASLVPGWSGASEVFAQIIPIQRLDCLLGGRFDGKQILIKIDVEGAELGTLRGAAATLRRTPQPWWLIEISAVGQSTGPNPHFADTFRLLRQAGYTPYTGNRACQPLDPTQIDHIAATGDNRIYNWLFLPEALGSTIGIVVVGDPSDRV
jgi:FkbM family methyltransferase